MNSLTKMKLFNLARIIRNYTVVPAMHFTIGSILKQFMRERGTDLHPMHSLAVLQSPKAGVQTWNGAKVRPVCSVITSDLHSWLC